MRNFISRWFCIAGVLGALIAQIILRPSDDALRRSLLPLPSVDHSDSAAVLRHFASRRPFVVRGGFDMAWSSRLLDDCGNGVRPFLISHPTAEVLKDMHTVYGASWRPVQWLIELWLGAVPEEFYETLIRPLTLREAVNAVRRSASRRVPVWIARAVALVAPRSAAARAAEGLGSVTAAPLYISNWSPDFCHLLRGMQPPAWVEAVAAAELRRACGRNALERGHDALEGGRPAAQFPRFFWGGAGSISYPLHIDGFDGDIVLAVARGAKEIVVLADNATDAVEGMRIQGTQAYGIDVFDHAAIPGVVGWAGKIESGEAVFIPGGREGKRSSKARHAVRNVAVDTVSLMWRPWRASVIDTCFRKSTMD